MADEDERERDENAEEEEDEEAWAEPVDLEGLPEGNTTIFVGGFSPCANVASALAMVKHKDDQIVVLPGEYPSDVALDSTLHQGLRITGDSTADASSIVFKGLLDINYTAPDPNKKADEPEDDLEADPKKKPEPPRLLTLSGISFLGGGVFTELSNCLVQDCIFGAKHTDKEQVAEEDQVPRTVRVHGLSTVTFRNTRIYGTDRSAVYCYPHARARFEGCEIFGATKPPPPPPETRRKKTKKVAEAPPPPPAVPESCECEAGVHCDDGSATFAGCSIRLFKMGVVCNDLCKGTTFTECTVSEIGTVGFLLTNKCAASLKENQVKLCGRECLVIGKDCHPTVRGNIFVGDARLSRGSVGTGVSDNILGLNGRLYEEDSRFTVKGFTTVEKDPTLKKKRKPVEEE